MLTDDQKKRVFDWAYNSGYPALTEADFASLETAILGPETEGADRRFLCFIHNYLGGGMADMKASFTDYDTALSYLLSRADKHAPAYIYDRLLGKEVWSNVK